MLLILTLVAVGLVIVSLRRSTSGIINRPRRR